MQSNQKTLNHLETVINTSVSAIIAIDNNLKVLTFNKAAQKMFGYSLEEMLELNNLHLIIPDKYISLHDKALALFLKTNKPSGLMQKQVEVEAKRKDGTLFPVKILIDFTGSGEDLVIVANIIDISLEKYQEEAFLNQMRMAKMGEMISMIAHQWRQPLGSIAASAINLQMKIELDIYDLDDECKTYFTKELHLINEFTQSLSSTINDFRNFYNPDKERVVLSIDQPIQKAFTIISRSLETNNINVIKDCKASNKLSIYDGEMMQVLLNILKNSEDNFKENHISNPEIIVKTRDIKNGSIIEISDNGGGIPEDIIEKIFDPYYSTKDNMNGTGLGLYMSKSIIEKHHNGKLSVENVNSGVCFTIEIRNYTER